MSCHFCRPFPLTTAGSFNSSWDLFPEGWMGRARSNETVVQTCFSEASCKGSMAKSPLGWS